MATLPIITYVALAEMVDHAGKHSRIAFNVLAADYAAWKTDTSVGTVRALFDAYEAESLDTVLFEQVSERLSTAPITVSFPASENAVNSAKLQVNSVDTVTGKGVKNEIPARNAANYTSIGGQVIRAGGAVTAQITTLIAKIQLTQVSEDGNPILVKEIKVVGRGSAA